MKTQILGTLVFFDLFFACLGIVIGIVTTFTIPWIGWGLILLGIWQGAHFYYLLWGVEECLLEEEKK